MSEDQSWYSFLNSSYKTAIECFSFLESRGFQLVETVEATGNNARYDGWHFLWKGPIDIKLKYYEWEFNVIFIKNETTASYLFIDDKIFDNRSGFQGSMFGPENLKSTIEKTAQDIEYNYEKFLSGDPFIWKRIGDLLNEAQRKIRAMRLEEDRKNAFRFERIDAKEAFQKRKYKKVVELLKDAEDYLEPLEKRKLEYARKKVKEAPWWKMF